MWTQRSRTFFTRKGKGSSLRQSSTVLHLNPWMKSHGLLTCFTEKSIRLSFSSFSSPSSFPSCSETIVRDVGLLAEENYSKLTSMTRRPLTGNQFEMSNDSNSKKNGFSSFSSSRWHLIDAKDQIVGRLASQIATILRGKHKPTYTRSRNSGDFVVVINAKDVVFTGRKMKDKKYYWHTLHPGGLKYRTPKQYIEKGNPEEILRHAVLGMLPKNSLRNEAIKKLRVFPDKYHLYEKELKGKKDLLQ